MLAFLHERATRIRAFFRSRDLDRELDQELESHLTMLAEENQRRGMTPERAEREARLKLGGLPQLREAHRETRGLPLLNGFLQDLHYALRGLGRNPGFTLTAIITMALGIGANTAIFSVVRAALLKPLPYATPDRIVVVESFSKNIGKTFRVSAPDFHDWRRQNRVLGYLAYHYGGEGPAVVNGRPAFARAQVISPDFFSVFGLPPAVGRFWSEEENGKPFAVVSYNWAQEQFADPRNAVGKTIKVYSLAVEVIGVAAPGFHYPDRADVWIPAGLFPENMHRSSHNYFAIGRLKLGVTLAAARQDLRAIGDDLEKQYSENRFKTVALTPLRDKLTQASERTLWILLAAVAGVLLIACANVANLQLARAATRHREMALRAAIGASRRRLLRQLLTESSLLAGIGALVGIGLAAIGLQALLAITPADLPRLDEASIDQSVLLFALGLAGLCAILFGLAPALRLSGTDLHAGLRQNSVKGTIGRLRNRTRSSLVVVEVALSVILLGGAGLLLRSFDALSRVNLGFSSDRLLLTNTSIAAPNEEAARRATEFQRDLIEQVRTLPGVRRAAGVRTLPFAANRSTATYWVKGGPNYRPGEAPSAQMQVITPGYFQSMGMRVHQGRDFLESDGWGSPQVAIINETLARDAFHDRSPFGHSIYCGMSPQSMNGMEIVGIVSDSRQVAPGEAPKPELFMPYLQHPGPGSNLTLVVQTQLAPLVLSSAIRDTVRGMNPELPVRFSTMNDVVFDSLAYPRYRTVLLMCFALVAAGLAIVGLYGVVSYLVAQRTSEIGLRLALGARPVDVFRFIIGGSMRLVGLGVALGLAGTLVFSRSLRAVLFGVDPQDPFTLVCVVCLVMLAALLASSIPAARAALMDPVIALRQE